jgi:pimeloyl-ACP methyl ester carboxylesterase
MKYIKDLFLLFYLLLLANVDVSSQEFISKEYLTSYDRQYIISNFGVPATNGTDLYKVRYTSTDLEGNPDTLSGLIAIPDTEDLSHPLLLYGHGTVGSREQVPSRLSGEHFLVAIFGALGYFTVGPDYLGLGDSKGIHPYVHADSEAWACYDMIKALRTSAEINDFNINEQNFIFGYSQGGHTAMALQRYMELENPDGYEVTASAPSSGPYSISEEMRNFTLGDEEYFFAAYLASTALSFEAAYGNILDERGLSSFFYEEYALEMEKYVNEEIDLFELNDRLIDRLIQDHGKSLPKLMVREEVLNDIFNNPNSPVAMALAYNDVYDWSPQAPTRLYYCMNDDQVTFTNSLVAEEAMKNNGGADILSLDVGPDLNHTECVPNALTLAIFFFDGFKNVTSSTYATANEKELVIYPNPASDVFYVQSDAVTSGSVEILDISGRRLLTSDWNNGQSIDVSSLVGGHYVVLLNSGERIEVHKLIIND